MFDAAMARVLRDERLGDISLRSYADHGGLLDAPIDRVWALVSYMLRALRRLLSLDQLPAALWFVPTPSPGFAPTPVLDRLTSGWSPLGP
jgi:hypothetical protein